MKAIRFAVAALACMALFVSGNQAQAQSELLFSESFESEPGMTYALSSVFDAPLNFFGRYDAPDPLSGVRDDFLSGFDGDFAIFGQDHNGDPNNPNGELATQSITIAGIDISGKDRLLTTISLGALNSEPDFDNYDAVDADGIQIFAAIDGGASVLIGEFAPNASGESDLYRDNNGDGIGNGTRLTTDLADFNFQIAGVGNTLDLVIELTSTDSFEPIVVDNVRVISVPEPSAAAILGAFGLFGVCRRRR